MSANGAGGAAPAMAPAPSAAWPMIRAMVGIGVVCGVAIVAAFQLTRPVIERKRAEALRAAVFQVLPGAATSRTYKLEESGAFTPLEGKAEGARLVYAAYDAEGRLLGVAIEAAGMGYQDTIRVLYGYAPERRAVVGFRVLETRETPGLGDKIDVDPEFLANFEALDVALADDRQSLAHPIELVKKGEKTQKWQIDAITGATVSSRAVANILRESTAFWMPRIEPRVEDFRAGGAP
ncbi:MAG: RnfABCDGE type electron transport complex subunit [Acidobacteria bacterium]|nr:RnfABCDGE type electron transport complex subunit [Acidobacteriota bacterium]